MTGTPPTDVAAAAATVQRWLDGSPPQKATDDQFKAMTNAQRIDHCRQFPQILETGRKV